MKALYKNVPFFGVRMSFARDLGLDLAVHLFRMFFFLFFYVTPLLFFLFFLFFYREDLLWISLERIWFSQFGRFSMTFNMFLRITRI